MANTEVFIHTPVQRLELETLTLSCDPKENQICVYQFIVSIFGP